jgi:hypothetical protein
VSCHSSLSNGPRYIWCIEKYPTVDSCGNPNRLMTGNPRKPHTGHVLKFQCIKADLELTASGTPQIGQWEANGPLVEREIFLPIAGQGVGGNDPKAAILDGCKPIEHWLNSICDTRWWVPEKDELKGGDLQRHLLAYALAACPVCE